MTKPTRDARILSGAYVLDALTAQEVLDMDAALRGDEDLRGEVAELTDTAVLLGLAVPSAEPSPALRARLLDLIEHTPQLDAVDAADETIEPHDEIEAAAPAHRAAVTPGPARWFRRPVGMLAAAAAAIALLFGGGVLVQHAVDPGTTQQASAFAELVSSPDLRQGQVAVTGGGTAVAYWSPGLRRSAVVLKGVAAPAGHVLQLWHIRDGSATSAGLYDPHGEHYQMLQDVPTSEQRIGVTVEPQGGSKTPTTKPIALVSVA